MALTATTIESYAKSLIKRAQNQGHTSSSFGLYEDPAPRGGPGSVMPSHPILHTNQIIAETLTTPPVNLGHLADDGTIKQFGDQDTSMGHPRSALRLVEIASVGDSRAWIAVDGTNPAVDEPWALKAPGVGFLDAWVDGDGAPSAIQNSDGYSYRARFWWGDPEPAAEIDFATHPSRPVWDPSTGILVWAGGSPYASIITPAASLWFTGYLYIGSTAADLISAAGGGSNPWRRVTGMVSSGTSGVGTLGQPVTYDLGTAIVNQTTALIFQNGVLLSKTADYTFPSSTTIRFTQTRRLLGDGDELQFQYEIAP